MYLNSRGLLSFPSFCLSSPRNSFFCRARRISSSLGLSLLLPPSASLVIGVTCSLGRSLYGRSPQEKRSVQTMDSLSLSLSLSFSFFFSLRALRPSSSRPPRCSRVARLPLVPSISNYGFPSISLSLSFSLYLSFSLALSLIQRFSHGTRKRREGITRPSQVDGKTWQMNSSSLRFKVSAR